MILTENLQKVRDDVKNCGREVTLIAASKTQPKEVVDEFMTIAPDYVLAYGIKVVCEVSKNVFVSDFKGVVVSSPS